jgi:hypothetical protein
MSQTRAGQQLAEKARAAITKETLAPLDGKERNLIGLLNKLR